MRWWAVMLVALGACDPEGSDFETRDAARLDRGATDRGGSPGQAVMDATIDASPDMAPGPDQGPMDATPMDAAAMDATRLDATFADAAFADAAIDLGADAALDLGLDLGSDAGVDGPFCGDARRLPLDGVFNRVGPVDRPAYPGCGAPGAAWSAFIELDEARLVTVKPGAGRVQLKGTCDAGAGACDAGARRFELPAGRTDFVFLDTDSVRVRSTPDCQDGADNDGDGRVDLDDPGCARADDWTEVQRPGLMPACANGVDDDGDGRADWPFNMRCPSPGSALEACRETPRGSPTSTTPETVLLDRVGGQPAALDCAAPADTIEILLVAPWSGRATIQVDAVGGQAMEILRACDTVERCSDVELEAALPVTRGEVLRVRVQGRPRWLRWQISAPAGCANGLDDDEDGLIDLLDPGCRDLDDDTEADPADVPACSNGVDDDRDRGADFPEDFACRGPGGPTEIEACAVTDFRRAASPTHWTPRRFADASCGGGDTPERGLMLTLERPTRIRIINGISYLRTDCADPNSERGCVDGGGVLGPVSGDLSLYLEGDAALAEPAFVPQRRCGNSVDDDADGAIDAADPGCTDRFDDDERDPPAVGECGDGVDNDGDNLIDWPQDPGCRGLGDLREAARCPGLLDVAPVDRLVMLDDFDHLPITQSVADGRPVYAVLVPLIIDRPALRRFAANPGVNWVPLIECEPADRRAFGSERLLNADRGELLMRLEVDVDAAHPFIEVGGLVPDCRNGLDDDGDGLIDGDDPGCARQALTERDDVDVPECADGVDNDGDGLTDGDDLECLGAADAFEGGVCVTDVVAAPVTQSAARWLIPVESSRFGLGCGPATVLVSAVVPIELAEAGRISARTIEGTGDPVLSLERDCDAPLACADDSSGLQASIARDVPAGRYALRVGRWDPADRSPIQVVISIE